MAQRRGGDRQPDEHPEATPNSVRPDGVGVKDLRRCAVGPDGPILDPRRLNPARPDRGGGQERTKTTALDRPRSFRDDLRVYVLRPWNRTLMMWLLPGSTTMVALRPGVATSFL